MSVFHSAWLNHENYCVDCRIQELVLKIGHVPCTDIWQSLEDYDCTQCPGYRVFTFCGRQVLQLNRYERATVQMHLMRAAKL